MRALQSLLLCTLLIVAAGPVWAHARLVKAIPADGASLSRAPTSVVLVFNEAPEIEFSSLKLAGSDGAILLAQTPVKGPTTNSLALPLSAEALRAGSYIVNYRVLSVDGHLVEGRTTFSIAPVTP